MSRTRIVVIFAMIALITVATLGVWQWTEYSRSPQYSLARLLLAANEGDWAEVQVYLDIGAVTDEVADRIVEREVDTQGPFAGLMEQLADAAKPAVAKQVEERLRATVESRARRNGAREYFAALWTTRNAKRTVLRGGAERVTVSVSYRGRRYDFVLRMKRAGPVWRVVAVENLPALLGKK